MTHILVVDDNEQNLYYLRALLTANGNTVDLAHHGAEALVKARLHVPDIVVSDLLMPVMDGYTLLRHWKLDEQLRNVPFVVYTATYKDDKDQQLAFDLGADEFILKPEEPDQLLHRIRAVQDRPASGLALGRRSGDDNDLLQNYSKTLIRKLEEKSLKLEEKSSRLEEANLALQKELAERNQVEMILRLSEARLDLEKARLLDAQRLARMGSWDTDLATGVVQWTDETHRIFETDPATFVPTHAEFLTFVHPEDRERVDRAFNESLQHTEAYALEHRLLLPSGAIKHVDERWRVAHDFAGNAIRALGTCHDITDQRKAAETNRESEERFRLLARATNDAVRDWDIVHDKVWWNNGLEALFGFARSDVEDSLDFWANRIHPEDRENIVDQVHRVVESGAELWTGTYRFARRDGSYAHVWDRVTVVRDQAGEAIRLLGGMADISEQRRAESALQASLAELNLRNRELQDFAFVASHDLQEPLRKIRTFSEMLVAGYRDSLDAQAREFLDRMSRAAARMQVLIEDLLEYSRVARGAQPFGQTDLATVCREVLVDLEPRIESSGAQITVADLPTISADATQMRQLFQNLLSNALKFTDPQREAVISVVSCSADLNGVPACRLEIADNGIGFEEKFAERIFNPFQRLHARSEFEGTGIGLAIVRRIVERHQGTVAAFSERDKGSRFVVTLPVAGNRSGS